MKTEHIANSGLAAIDFLQQVLRQALESVSPANCLPPLLPELTTAASIVVVGAGKAAAAMAQVVEQHYPGRCRGVVVTRYGHAVTTRTIRVLQAAHPVPDQASVDAAQQLLAEVQGLTPNDVVIGLWSGGGSALLSLPATGLDLLDKQQIQRQLLASGAGIAEINTVRRFCSAIKSGHLAQACQPAQLYSFVLSDVPGDNPALVASGPMYPEVITKAAVSAILQRYQISLSPAAERWFANCPACKPQHGDVLSGQLKTVLIAKAQTALQAAAAWARARGVNSYILGDDIEGEAQSLAQMHAALIRQIVRYQQPFSAPCLILSGGEASVRHHGQGRGGRNSEFMLALQLALKGAAHVYALAVDTDGIDGSGDNAGAWFSPACWQRASQAGLDARTHLDRHTSYDYFAQLGNLLVTGPTLTNVNDFRAILIWPAGDNPDR